MVFTLLALTTALVGVVGSSAAGPLREEDAHGVAEVDDPDAGFRAFGKAVSVFAVIATVVIVVVAIMMILSLAGFWENDNIDPPV